MVYTIIYFYNFFLARNSELMAKVLIELNHVSKKFKVFEGKRGFLGFCRSLLSPRYRTIQAVKDLNLSINEGEIVGYIGPNGAGKSTTIKMIAGVMKPTSGKVLVAGRDPGRNRITHQLELGVVLGQRSRLLWDLPVRESFIYQGLVYRVPYKTLQKNINQVVQMFDISSLFEQPVRQLSLGQRMRCEIALNLLHQPRILLLDEPTIGLDIDAKASLRNAIRHSARELNTTIILTSHDLGDVEALSNRIVILSKGKIIFDGNLKQLRTNYQIPSSIHFRISADVSQVHDWLIENPGVTGVTSENSFVVVSYSETITTPAQITALLLQKAQIHDFSTKKPSIEEVVSAVYHSHNQL